MCTGIDDAVYQALQDHPTNKLFFFCESCTVHMRTHVRRSWRANRRASSECQRPSSTGPTTRGRKRDIAESQQEEDKRLTAAVASPEASVSPSSVLGKDVPARKKGRPRKRPCISTGEIATSSTVTEVVPPSRESYAAVARRTAPQQGAVASGTADPVAPGRPQLPATPKLTSSTTEPLHTPREHCLLFFGVPDSTKASPQDRHAEDMAFLQRMVDKLLDKEEAGVTVKALIRLGSLNPEATKGRPLKVVFTGPTDPTRLLRRAFNLG